jgi:hypothetical protein
MFGDQDRAFLRILESKIEALVSKIGAVESRVGIVESRLSIHDKDANVRHAEQARFEQESRADRAQIRAEVWKSNDKLLWKIISAMAGMMALAITVALSFLHLAH